MPQTIDLINFPCGPDMTQWPKLTCTQPGHLDLQDAGLRLPGSRDILFQDNGQIRSFDDTHRLVFDRAGGLLELHEAGAIRLLTGSPTPTEKLRILANGQVGIGTATPTSALHVTGDIRTDGALRVAGHAAVGGTLTVGSTVVIGTATPTQTLDVNGTVRATGFQGNGAGLTGISDPSRVSKGGDTMTGVLHLPIDGLSVGSQLALAGGNVGIGTVSPLARLQVVDGAIMPAAGASAAAGLLFPLDPGGGLGDAAWMRYYPRAGEGCTLEIGVSNDADDHIALMPSGNVGIGINNPTSGKLQFANALGNKLVVWDGGATDRYGIGLNGDNLNAFVPVGARFSLRNNGFDGAEPFSVTGTGNVRYNGQLSKLDVANNFSATIRAADLNLGYSGRRGSPGRALVDLGNALVLNFGPDWPDCVIGSQLHVSGAYMFVNGARGESAYLGGDGHGNDVQVGSSRSGINNLAAYNSATGQYMAVFGRVFHSVSDARHKEQIEGVSHALDQVLRLRAVSFRWKDGQPAQEQTRHMGLIAQEVQEVCPEAVSQDRHGHLTLDYNAITAVLVEAVKEQAAQIKALQQKIAELEQLTKR